MDPTPAWEVRPQRSQKPCHTRHLPPCVQPHGLRLRGRHYKGVFLVLYFYASDVLTLIGCTRMYACICYMDVFLCHILVFKSICSHSFLLSHCLSPWRNRDALVSQGNGAVSGSLDARQCSFKRSRSAFLYACLCSFSHVKIYRSPIIITARLLETFCITPFFFLLDLIPSVYFVV